MYNGAALQEQPKKDQTKNLFSKEFNLNLIKKNKLHVKWVTTICSTLKLCSNLIHQTYTSQLKKYSTKRCAITYFTVHITCCDENFNKCANLQK